MLEDAGERRTACLQEYDSDNEMDIPGKAAALTVSMRNMNCCGPSRTVFSGHEQKADPYQEQSRSAMAERQGEHGCP